MLLMTIKWNLLAKYIDKLYICFRCILIALGALVLTSSAYDVIQRVRLKRAIPNETLNELQEASVNGLGKLKTGSRSDINLESGLDANIVSTTDLNNSYTGIYFS